MALLKVFAEKRLLQISSHFFPCILGKGGFGAGKIEGDGKTPLGRFPLREIWHRADRVQLPPSRLPLKTIQKDDGWCDDPLDVNYNKHVKLPYAGRHEELWREDNAYNIVIVIGYNDAPPVPHKGSAIFMHVNHDDRRETGGCVSLAFPDMLQVISALDENCEIEIAP